MTSTLDNFPVDAVKGCRYLGEEGDITFEGTVTEVERRRGGEYLAFYNDEGEAFGIAFNWGSWYRENGNQIVITIPMVGRYRIFGVETSS